MHRVLYVSNRASVTKIYMWLWCQWLAFLLAKQRVRVRIPLATPNAFIAQLAEQLTSNQQVASSNLAESSTYGSVGKLV